MYNAIKKVIIASLIFVIFSIYTAADIFVAQDEPPIPPFDGQDSDGDGVPDLEDMCPDTVGTQIVYGCSCQQILDLKPGKDIKDCSPGSVKVFTKQIGWSKKQ
jgi:hypothetical protein